MKSLLAHPTRAARAAALTAALAAAPATVAAQEPTETPAAPAIPGPPVQRIATASAVSKERLGFILGLRELPDGRVLVNDGGSRRLLLMDTAMKTVGVVLDSVAAVENAYGAQQGVLIPFRGDSTLFVDPASFAMLVLDPAGKVVRVRSVWRVQDVPYLAMGFGSSPAGVDARGRVVYRVPARPAPPRVRPPAGVPYIPEEPDSALVVAADLDTRKVDTLGVLRTPKRELSVRRNTDGRLSFDMVTNPLPVTDEWAVLSDGRVAFLRGRDYRIEYLGADGGRTSSGRLPYPWQRLTDDDKQRLVDSVKVAQQRAAGNEYITALIRWVNQFGRGYPAGMVIPDGYVVPPGLPKDWKLPEGVKLPANYIYACPPGEDPLPPGLQLPGAAAALMGALVQAPSAGVAPQTRVVVGAPVGAVAPSSADAAGKPVVAVPPADGRQTVVVSAPTAAPGAPGAVAPVADRAGPPAAAAALALPAVPGAGRSPGDVAAAAAALGLRCLPAPMSFNTGRRPPPPTPRSVRVVPPSDLPDYRPAFAPGAVRADMDGSLWIRTVPVRAVAGGTVFDVVDRAGGLVTRLQIPPGYTVAGFGRGRVVYLSMRDMTGIHLARVRLK